ncbi:unnamed protein product [Penicillium olsonii]|nr:unnamed protein product [Penicillium olsonii]CAG7923384.1 unnamed protein product [Penicillium olsonii]
MVSGAGRSGCSTTAAPSTPYTLLYILRTLCYIENSCITAHLGTSYIFPVCCPVGYIIVIAYRDLTKSQRTPTSDLCLPTHIDLSHTHTLHPIMSNATQNKEPTEQPPTKPQVLEEDDEFEDFPIEDWPQEEAEQTTGSAANGGSEHLWEESWDDDDAAEDFSKQLQCVPSRL